jgi:hypothetical protein
VARATSPAGRAGEVVAGAVVAGAAEVGGPAGTAGAPDPDGDEQAAARGSTTAARSTARRLAAGPSS